MYKCTTSKFVEYIKITVPDECKKLTIILLFLFDDNENLSILIIILSNNNYFENLVDSQ